MFEKQNQIRAAISGSFGAIGLGLGLSWLSPAGPYLDQTLGPEVNSWIGAFFPIGALVSSVLTGYAMSQFGRKMTIIYMSVPFSIGWILLALAKPLGVIYDWYFYAGRFFSGK